MTSTDTPTQPITRRARILSLIRRAVSMEKIIYANIARAVSRRPAVPIGGKGFRFHTPVLTILWIFIILSAVELVVVDLIVHRWPIPRVIFLVIGIWGLVWMFGLLCGYYMRPHTVGPFGVEIRNGLDLDVPISWDDVHSVAIKKHTYDSKDRIIADGDKEILVVPILSETNIEIVLERPTCATLPGLHPKGGQHNVSVIRLWADDPRSFLDEVRNHI
ncbi:hypothetical protein [Leucobacter sp. wl10]|uniref:hypothetical protein n=1 Tax=Leucobacter sp. wl10 TaxID=2304677 RepID=UPI0013C33D5A|nr:hypothetical protein [Leucobacter sp. wl10]